MEKDYPLKSAPKHDYKAKALAMTLLIQKEMAKKEKSQEVDEN